MANSIRTQMVHHTRGGATTPPPAQRDADTVLQNLIYTYPRVFLRTRQLPGVEGPRVAGCFTSISDDMTRVYFRDRDTRCWHTLTWERAASPDMPLSEGAAAPPRRAPTTTNTMGAMMGGLGSNGTRAFSAQLAQLH
jgi:hypothetical protein